MKSLFKLGIIILLISVTSESFAQTFGVKAGLNLSNMLIKESQIFVPYNTNVPDPKLKFGFNIGAVVEYPVLDLFSFESGLFVTTLGTKLTTKEPFGATTLVTKAKHDLYYFSIPLEVKVPFSIKGLNFFGSAGAYAGLGLIGKADTIITFGDLNEKIKGKIAWGSEQSVDYLKRFDYGLNFGIGMKLSSFQVGLSYNLGLANFSSDSEIGSVAKNRVLGISVGYYFGGHKKTESSKPMADKVKEEKPAVAAVKSGKPSRGRKAAEIEAERLRQEKIRTDSIAAAAAEQERLRIEKARADSIEAARARTEKAEAERIRMEQIKADSIAAAQKAALFKNVVVYRVQFASNTAKKGSYSISIGGKNYNTWEYQYSGAYRSTVGEFKTLSEATAFQKIVRTSGYPQAFVVVFKNNVRSTDPALFK